MDERAPLGERATVSAMLIAPWMIRGSESVGRRGRAPFRWERILHVPLRLPEALPTLLFAFSSGLRFNYTENQNTYFVHGLARGPLADVLAIDWLASTRDPVPVFSAFVRATAEVGGPVFYSLLHQLLAASYFLGLLAIGRAVIERSAGEVSEAARVRRATFFAWGLLSLHLIDAVFLQVFYEGLANQYVVGRYLQPSTFGSWIVLGLGLWAAGHAPLGLLLCLLAALFHPTYLISVAWIVLGVAFATYRRRRSPAHLAGIMLASLAVLGPVALRSSLAFAPTTAETFAEAQRILVEHRLPHHADFEAWLDFRVIAALTIVGSAIVSGSKLPIAPALALAFVGSAFLSIAQGLTGSHSMALLFPWRSSTWLVPISTTILLAAWTGRFGRPEERRPGKAWLVLPSTGLLLGVGALAALLSATRSPNAPVDRDRVSLIRAIPRGERNRAVVLVPPDWEEVRVNAPAAIFVDWKSHPYKDTEVIEWFARNELARRFYHAGSHDCRHLHEILELEPRLGFVVLRGGQSPPACLAPQPIARSRTGAVFRLRTTKRGEPDPSGSRFRDATAIPSVAACAITGA